MQKQRLLYILLFAFSFQSCNDNVVYQKKHEISNETWIYADTLNFDFDIEDTTSLYSLFLNVAHADEYSFQNLYTKIYTAFPQGERIEEVLSIELADHVGNWMGSCSGQVCQFTLPIQQNVYFNQSGHYQITMEQFMREEALKGVHAIEFMLKKTGKQK